MNPETADHETIENHSFCPSRRRFLTGLGGSLLAGLAGLAAPAEGLAAATHGSASYNAFLLDYARYLAKVRLRYIKVKDVIDAHCKTRGGVANTPPPRSLWTRLVPTLRVADRLAHELRSSEVEIISAYRSPAYNARCPGARRESMHLRNMALDLRFKVSARDAAAVAIRMRDKGLFKGGIGRYSNFIHIDTRGENVDWRG
jgi:hypothetical protein